MKRTKTLHNLSSLVLAIIFCLLCFSAVSSQTSLRKALDYDGDGKADPAVFRSTTNTLWISKSTGPVTAYTFGTSPLDTLTPGDFDGDGKGDISVWRESTGTFYYIRSSDSVFVATQFGQAGDEPIARDYDGDGKTDCAVVRRQNGYLYWYILQSSNYVWLGSQYGIDTDFPAPGDYDGDGLFDLAVQRKGPGGSLIFYIYQTTMGATAVQFGYETDLFVPGDYDGDGKTDIAVARKEFFSQENVNDNYEWYVLNSSNGSVSTLLYGGADLGDIPVQADYDGDGKTDIAVWRGPEGRFYINQSSNGQTASSQLGTLGDLPVASYDTH